MPTIRVEMFEGRTIEQKREMAEVFTREMARIAKIAPDAIQVLFEEYRRDNWAVGGTLYADKTK